MQFFAYSLFEILKKVYLQILMHFFVYSLFEILRKVYLQILVQYFAYSLFEVLEKSIRTNPKKPGAIFYLFPFSNIKKNIFTNLGAIFCLFSFSNIKKVYLQILKKTCQNFFLILFFKY